MIAVMFKFMTSVINILEETRKTRLEHRDLGFSDFNNALKLYNEVLRGWLIKIVKTPVLTIIKLGDESMDFIPLTNQLMLDKTRRDRFLGLKIRVNTILSNLIQNSTPKHFPQPLMAFMNSFMVEGGFVPYEFLTDFEQDIFDFDSSDALMNFGGKQKFLFIGSFIIT